MQLPFGSSDSCQHRSRLHQLRFARCWHMQDWRVGISAPKSKTQQIASLLSGRSELLHNMAPLPMTPNSAQASASLEKEECRKPAAACVSLVCLRSSEFRTRVIDPLLAAILSAPCTRAPTILPLPSSLLPDSCSALLPPGASSSYSCSST